MAILKLEKRGAIHTSGLINIALSIFSAAISFYSLMLIAKTYGASSGSDAYFFLISITTLFTGLMGALFATVVLPIFIELKRESGKKEASIFFSSILSWCLIITLIIGLISYYFYNHFYISFSRFSSLQIYENRAILIYFGPVFIVGVLSELFRSAILASGEFVVAALSALLQPLFTVIAIFQYSNKLHEEAIAIAFLIAKIAVLTLFLSVSVFRNKLEITINFKKNLSTSKFLKVGFPYWSGNVITNFATFFFDYISSGFGPGILTSISYAQRVFSLPIALLVNPVLEIARTKFSESQVENDKKNFMLLYRNLATFVIYLTTPVGLFFFFFASDIISILFQRGAFDSNSVSISANCLKVLAISVPFSALFMLNGRACESFQRLKWPSIFGTFGNLMMILLTYVLINNLGYIGIPYAKLLIDLLYFLPFGFIAFGLFSGEFEIFFFIRKLFFAATASILAVLISSLSGLVHLLDDRNYGLIKLSEFSACFFIIYLLILFLIITAAKYSYKIIFIKN